MRRLEIEWQTKVLGAFIANTAPNADTAKELIKHLNSVYLVDQSEQAEIGPADTPGERERSLEDIIENGSTQSALARNNRRQGPGLPFG